MHVRNIEKVELNGMILQHTQSEPEIVYNGCVLCFLSFDGDIKGVGTRITGLNADEFMTLKTLVDMIDFEDEEVNYIESVRCMMKNVKTSVDQMLEQFDDWNYFIDYNLDALRKKVSDIDFIRAKMKQNE